MGSRTIFRGKISGRYEGQKSRAGRFERVGGVDEPGAGRKENAVSHRGGPTRIKGWRGEAKKKGEERAAHLLKHAGE